jgi:hypothetical protein
MISWF